MAGTVLLLRTVCLAVLLRLPVGLGTAGTLLRLTVWLGTAWTLLRLTVGLGAAGMLLRLAVRPETAGTLLGLSVRLCPRVDGLRGIALSALCRSIGLLRVYGLGGCVGSEKSGKLGHLAGFYPVGHAFAPYVCFCGQSKVSQLFSGYRPLLAAGLVNVMI